jgi:hypothetical protein
MGRVIGYCDLDCDRTTCYGDTDLLEKPDTLGKYLLRNSGKKEAWDGGREYMPAFQEANELIGKRIGYFSIDPVQTLKEISTYSKSLNPEAVFLKNRGRA